MKGASFASHDLLNNNTDITMVLIIRWTTDCMTDAVSSVVDRGVCR